MGGSTGSVRHSRTTRHRGEHGTEHEHRTPAERLGHQPRHDPRDQHADSNPLITVLIVLPCWPSGARCAAKGTSTCAATVVSPTTVAAAPRTPSAGATATTDLPGHGHRQHRDDELAAFQQVTQGTMVASPNA